MHRIELFKERVRRYTPWRVSGVSTHDVLRSCMLTRQEGQREAAKLLHTSVCNPRGHEHTEDKEVQMSPVFVIYH